MSKSKWNDVRVNVLAWTDALRASNGRVDDEHRAAAYGAGHEMMTDPRFNPSAAEGRELTALRAELAIAESVKLWEALTPEDDEKPRLAALMAEEIPPLDPRAFSPEDFQVDPAPPMVSAWKGWSAPEAASLDEGPGDVADRVAADLEGAAELLAELMVEPTTVPEPVAQRSSGNILRALASGAQALRGLVAARYDADPADSPVGRGDAMPMGAVRAIEQARRKAEQDADHLADVVRKRGATIENLETNRAAAAELAEKRAQTLQLRERELAEARQTVRQLQGRLARGDAPDGLKDVLRVLGNWAPGYDEMDPQELRNTALEVARRVVAELQAEKRNHAELRSVLNSIPEIGPRRSAGPLIDRVKAAVKMREHTEHVIAERDEARAELADADRKNAALVEMARAANERAHRAEQATDRTGELGQESPS
jgi:hypothetical protein